MIELFSDHWVKIVLGGISTVLSGVVTWLCRRIKQELAEQQLLKDAMLALMHDRLYQLCNKYIEIGSISTNALKNLEKIHSSYHALGGNGTGDTLFTRVKQLPIIN